MKMHSVNSNSLKGARLRARGNPSIVSLRPISPLWLSDEIFRGQVKPLDQPAGKRQRHTDQRLIYQYSSLDAEAGAIHKDNIGRLRPEIILHVSDEKLRHRSSNYRGARTVIRDYFNPNLQRSKVYFIPIGFRQELADSVRKLTPPDVRRFAWSFVGNLKGDRDHMLSVFNRITPNRQEAHSSGFMGSLPLTDDEVARVLVDSHFVLCPFGSLSPDTWRIMEALEAGAIPVTVSLCGVDYFRFIFGDHPFVTADSWERAADVVAEMMSDDAALTEKRSAVSEWYRDYKSRLSQDLLSILRGSKDPLSSEQFRYQRAARFSFTVRSVFWRHFTWSRLRRQALGRLDLFLKPQR